MSSVYECQRPPPISAETKQEVGQRGDGRCGMSVPLSTRDASCEGTRCAGPFSQWEEPPPTLFL